MSDTYEEILHLPHHVSSRHQQMPTADRAAQFAPFAALTGYGAAIAETGRLTERKIELGEYEQAALNDELNRIREQIGSRPVVTITYFKPDERKDGGAYLTVTEAVKKVDEYEDVLVLTSGAKIPFDDLMAIARQEPL